MDFEDADVRLPLSSGICNEALTPSLEQPDQFIDEGDVGVSGAADAEEEMGDAAGGVNGATTGGGVSLFPSHHGPSRNTQDTVKSSPWHADPHLPKLTPCSVMFAGKRSNRQGPESE